MSKIHQKEIQYLTGTGETLEQCFANMAISMFKLVSETKSIHGLQIITFDFTAKENDQALVAWLELVFKKAKEHQLIFGDFRLKRNNEKWEATISGEPYQFDQLNINSIALEKISINKLDHIWQACCNLSFKA